MIALLCPSKGRPEKAKKMVDSARASSSLPITIYMAIAQDDVASYTDINESKFVMPDLMPTAHKWNFLAQEIMRNDPSINLFMVAGDDMIFDTPGWDKALVDHYNALENKIHVYHLQDSRSEDGIPHPIMTREYIQAMGYFVPPIFLHWYIDTWTVEIAKYNDCFTHLKDYLLVHDKDNDKGQPDATHTGIRSYGWRDRDKWVHEACKNTLLVNECQRLRSLMRK